MAKAKVEAGSEVEEVVKDLEEPTEEAQVDVDAVLAECGDELEGMSRGAITRLLTGKLGNEQLAERVTSELFSGGGE